VWFGSGNKFGKDCALAVTVIVAVARAAIAASFSHETSVNFALF
jgi:hypothetical protein